METEQTKGSDMNTLQTDKSFKAGYDACCACEFPCYTTKKEFKALGKSDSWIAGFMQAAYDLDKES